MNEPLPPINIEAEEAILGGILLDPEAIVRVVDILVVEAFSLQSHQQIYRVAQTLHSQGKPTDLMSVSTYLADHKLLESVGGTTKLGQLINRTVSAVNIDRYAMLVMDKYLRRQVICAGHKIVDFGYDTTIELETVLDCSEQEIFQVSHQKMRSDTEHNSEIAVATFNHLEEHSPIYPTGLEALDHLMVGFEPGTMTILAGRPSMGKSAISLFLALQTMIHHELPVVIFSLEMTKKQLEYRLWSLISQLDCYRHLNLTPIRSDRLRQHRSRLCPLTPKEMATIVSIMEIAVELPLYMNENRGISVSSIASECRQIKTRDKKLGLVVVDYLQMMAADSSGNRSYELGDVARGLYKLAGELSVPVLALSQVSRGVEGRQNKRPMMCDLSQSGILEMVADNIIFAYRDEYYNRNTSQPGVLELILAKARHGDTGTAEVLFDKSSGLIRSFKEFA
ncbi:MAG: replicative DNA helicase [Xenococcaceae cyanobacterium MO_234.B1]|nr:replicative DNA helicase [Xenococcaceae cyanobacterium MO_234.B1]